MVGLGAALFGRVLAVVGLEVSGVVLLFFRWDRDVRDFRFRNVVRVLVGWVWWSEVAGRVIRRAEGV